MVQMLGGGSIGSRRRYLAEQAIQMEELFGKAEGFTTPITKPTASFKAPAAGGGPKMAAPKAALKPTGGKLPTSSERLQTLRQGLADKIGQTDAASGAPAAVGTVGKSDKLRRKGKFQRLRASSVVKSYIPGVGYRAASALTSAQRAAVRAEAGTARRFRSTQPLSRRGTPAAHSDGNKMLRELGTLTRGGEKSANRNITFGPKISQADRERVLRVAPRKLKGGKVHVDYSDAPSPLDIISGRTGPEGFVVGGSRRVPAMLRLKPGTTDHTVAHEFTHANRKSLNAHRLKQITGDKAKLGREEGRADAGAARAGYKRRDEGQGSFDYEQFGTLAGAKRTNPVYRYGNRKIGGNAPFNMKEYNGVRRKMGVPVAGKLQPSNHRMLRQRATEAALTSPALPLAVGAVSLPISIRNQRKQEAQRKAKAAAARQARKAGVTKREPLKTAIGEDDARKLVDRHGLKGPLPKNLNREQKMAAYEARYVSAGGKKAEKWSRRAETADKAKNIGLGVATAGGAAWLGTRAKTYKSIKSIKNAGLRHHADNIAVGGAVAGGAGELYAGHARRKRSSYASAPAGVAASALRRMRDYTPDSK